MDSQYRIVRLTADDVRPGDETAIVGLYAELHAARHEFLPIFTQDDIRAHARDNKFFVARESATGEIVGMATLVTSTYFGRKKGAVEEVVVSEAHQRKGNARSIMEELLRAAKESQLRGLHLTSADIRHAAQRLYLALGFKDKGATRSFILPL
jgi:GNAT superfamily N-acetyltransferase